MTQPVLFLHLQDPELTSLLLQSDIVRRFVICKSQPDECWAEQLLRQPCDLAFIEIDNTDPAQYELLQQSNMLAEIDFILVSKGIPDLALDQLMRCGAGYHFRQPLDMASVLDAVEDFYQQLSTVAVKRKVQSSDLDQFGLLVGSSRAMLKLYRTLRKVAVTEANVFIAGESGAGKELVANTLHLASHRAEQPFVAINCGALPEHLLESELFGHTKGAFTGAVTEHGGLFREADGGTLFLDEIGDMPVALQVKLLRALQERQIRPVGSSKTIPINVRVLSATHRDLQQAMQDGSFREDLYYRLNVVNLQLPTLEQRPEDIPLLARHVLQQSVERHQVDVTRFSDDAMQLLATAKWPGNVRQLVNVVEQCVALTHSPVIGAAQVEQALSQDSSYWPSLTEARDQFERQYLIRVLQMTEGNVTRAAELAGRNRTDFYKLLKKHELSAAQVAEQHDEAE